MKNNYNYLWIVLISFLVSCSDMNDLHQPYLDQGEHLYAAKVDAVVVRPGNERIQLDLFYTAQRIKECVIYWNVRQNSLVKELPASGVNGVPVLLEDMPEGTYSFEIVTKDLYGNESLVVEASGKSYGNSYKSGLINARYSSITKSGEQTIITWRNVEFATEIEFTYETATEGEKTIMIPVTIDGKTILTDNKPGGAFHYVTWYRPTEYAIDDFICNNVVTGVLPE